MSEIESAAGIARDMQSLNLEGVDSSSQPAGDDFVQAANVENDVIGEKLDEMLAMADTGSWGGGSDQPVSSETSAMAVPEVDINKLSDNELIQFLQQKEIQRQRQRQEMREKKKKPNLDSEHKFWDTQPVPSLRDNFEGECGPLDPNTDLSTIRSEPYNMPTGFEWCSLDVNDPNQIQEIYVLLNENYVEDDDCLFRFDYSKPFLQWALTPPGYLTDWHVGVRNSKTGVLMGCITAIPAEMSVHGQHIPMVEINFLCVHKKLR